MREGAQTRRTANVIWHEEDILEIHPHDTEVRGISDGGAVTLTSRVGETTLHAVVSDRMPAGSGVHDVPLPHVWCERGDDRQL